ncbi:MAG: hypothetical protein IIZ99_06025 [Turicibacter sp.]|nr:hypothetical protein [Turicibacter sp.]
MEQKADYAELRKVYFGYREQDKMPSHSGESNFHSKLDEPCETSSSRIHRGITEILDENEKFSLNFQNEVNELKSPLSQRSNDIRQTLQDKYGTGTYSKITEMINSEDFTEWNQLEQELLSVQLNPLIDQEKADDNQLTNFSSSGLGESFEELAVDAQSDLDYLDALMQHDYGRLHKLQSNSESICSIFSEIIENEQNSNSNYQDDIFNRNIELIFNSDVDLDECEWEEVETSTVASLPATNLDEVIEQLKQESSLIEKDEAPFVYHEQASLEAFYSEQLREQLNEEQSIKEVETPLPSKSRKTSELKIALLVVAIIILATFVYMILQSKYAI